VGRAMGRGAREAGGAAGVAFGQRRAATPLTYDRTRLVTEQAPSSRPAGRPGLSRSQRRPAARPAAPHWPGSAYGGEPTRASTQQAQKLEVPDLWERSRFARSQDERKAAPKEPGDVLNARGSTTGSPLTQASGLTSNVGPPVGHKNATDRHIPLTRMSGGCSALAVSCAICSGDFLPRLLPGWRTSIGFLPSGSPQGHIPFPTR